MYTVLLPSGVNPIEVNYDYNDDGNNITVIDFVIPGDGNVI
jgi:hypothetical protein